MSQVGLMCYNTGTVPEGSVDKYYCETVISFHILCAPARSVMAPYQGWCLLLSLLFTGLAGCARASSENPFSPRASLLRHWNRLFPSEQMPGILLSKASPLNASQVAVFSRYIDEHSLPAHAKSFCSAANLFCDVKLPANVTHDVRGDADFSTYSNKQFRRYQSGSIFGSDTFRNYSVGENVARDMFAQYQKDGTGGTESFSNYALSTNVAGSDFNNYDSNGNGVLGDFRSYGAQSNVQGHNFATYGSGSSADTEIFTSYSEQSNVVRNNFKNYGKDSNGMGSQFAGYATSSNVGTNSFKGYGADGNGGTDFFRNYGDKINVARNDFQSYSKDGNGPLEDFTSYGDQAASLSDNEFRSYGKGTNGLSARFTSYGNTTGDSKNEFVEYNKDAAGTGNPQFSTYFGNETSFKQYIGSPGSFDSYFNASPAASTSAVEAGKFFRQANLATGRRIPMPDIRDKMPSRSFLPRALADKLPFSSAQLPELVEILGTSDLRALMSKTVAECERPAAKDETKRCVTSLEGMAEFAVSVLGKSAAVSTTASTAGWGKTLVVGKVAARHGGKETRSVSCHQSLFPYLVYYCHAVPRVAVYDVDLLEKEGGDAVNKGVAICHLDTSQWSAGHAAFLALGPAPGKIEVCHWIFQNDVIWVARD